MNPALAAACLSAAHSHPSQEVRISGQRLSFCPVCDRNDDAELFFSVLEPEIPQHFAGGQWHLHVTEKKRRSRSGFISKQSPAKHGTQVPAQCSIHRPHWALAQPCLIAEHPCLLDSLFRGSLASRTSLQRPGAALLPLLHMGHQHGAKACLAWCPPRPFCCTTIVWSEGTVWSVPAPQE